MTMEKWILLFSINFQAAKNADVLDIVQIFDNNDCLDKSDSEDEEILLYNSTDSETEESDDEMAGIEVSKLFFAGKPAIKVIFLGRSWRWHIRVHH